MQVLEFGHPVDILTANYRVSGEMKIRGSPTIYLNDLSTTTLTVLEASVVPLRPGI